MLAMTDWEKESSKRKDKHYAYESARMWLAMLILEFRNKIFIHTRSAIVDYLLINISDTRVNCKVYIFQHPTVIYTKFASSGHFKAKLVQLIVR